MNDRMTGPCPFAEEAAASRKVSRSPASGHWRVRSHNGIRATNPASNQIPIVKNHRSSYGLPAALKIGMSAMKAQIK